MRLSRILIALLMALLAGFAVPPTVARAQRAGTPPAGKVAGQVAGIAPAPAPPAQADHHERHRPVFFGTVPVVVLADGRVFADFGGGRGFERIVSSCGVPVSFDGQSAAGLVQPTVVQPSVRQPSAGAIQPLPYTPPVPSQPTASQQMLPLAAQQTLASHSTLVNTQMCWSNDQRGRVFVGRP